MASPKHGSKVRVTLSFRVSGQRLEFLMSSRSHQQSFSTAPDEGTQPALAKDTPEWSEMLGYKLASPGKREKPAQRSHNASQSP